MNDSGTSGSICAETVPTIDAQIEALELELSALELERATIIVRAGERAKRTIAAMFPSEEPVSPEVRHHLHAITGFVYFISDGEAVKIGFSAIPESRMTNLQGGSPRDLKMLGKFPASLDNEQALHRKYKPSWIRGEWFRLDKDVMALIEALKGGLTVAKAVS